MIQSYSVKICTDPEPNRQMKEAATESVLRILGNGFDNCAVEVGDVRVEGRRMIGNVANITVKPIKNSIAPSTDANGIATGSISFIDVYRAFPQIRRRAFENKSQRKEWSLKVEVHDSSIHIIHNGLKDMATIRFIGKDKDASVFYAISLADITTISGVQLFKTGCYSPNLRTCPCTTVSIDTLLKEFDWKTMFGPLGDEMQQFFISEVMSAITEHKS